MSTRSAMNKRTQDQLREGKKGMARKSAASAKPARVAAGSVRVVPASAKAKRRQAERGEDLSTLTKEEKRARKAEVRAQEDRVYAAMQILMKEDFEYSRARKIWYLFMALGVALIVVAFVLLMVLGDPSDAALRVPQYVVVAAAYVAIIGGFVWDFVKIRPIRNECRAKAEGMTEGRLNAVLERGAAAQDKKRKK